MSVPSWVQDAVFYQVFPDRFANGDPSNDPPNVQPWGSTPTLWGFQGGDLRGIIEKFEYLLELGVNAIYLNPIFLSPSTHRYNTSDYFRIDPRLGDENEFRTLLNVAHSNDLRVIMDGVFNHCSRGFFAFADLLENQEHSGYQNWFHVKKFPVEAYSPGEAESYLAWWGFKSLPKLKPDNPDVRRYLLHVARYWIEQGADGWRLDVPNEIDDDSFWAEFRHTVKSVNPEAYLVGEIWISDPRWVGESHFDGLMNYPLREIMLDLLNNETSSITGFAERVEKLLSMYPVENTFAMYNTLGSHDTKRILTKLGENKEKLKLAFTFLFGFPGAPAIYYGDEIGLIGGEDPECRKAFPWDSNKWLKDLRDWVRNLIAIRMKRTALRRGDFRSVLVDDKQRCYAFARTLGDEIALVVLNPNPTPHDITLPVSELDWEDGHIIQDLLSQAEYLVSGGKLNVTLPAWGSTWLG